MKKVVILFTHVLTSVPSLVTAQQVPANCFKYSAAVGQSSSGTEVNNQEQVLGSEFSFDMKLHKIQGCMGPGDTLKALTFILKSSSTTDPVFMELESIGNRFQTNCEEAEIARDEAVSYLEVTYNSNEITSFFAKTGQNTNVLFGSRQPGNESKGWSFNAENSLIGLKGGFSSKAIQSIGVLIFQPACAQKSLGLSIDPNTGQSTGSSQRDYENADGTFQFAPSPLKFENEALGKQKHPDDRNIWSLQNPTLVEDVKEWAQESPNFYYAVAAALFALFLIISCLCCCVRACIGCCCSSNKTQVTNSSEMTKIVSAKKQQQIRVRDVLQEQRTCEEISENDEVVPTQRKLVTQESDARIPNIQVGINRILSSDGAKTDDTNRKNLAEQIMYGSSSQRKEIAPRHDPIINVSQAYTDRKHSNMDLFGRDQNNISSPPETRDSYIDRDKVLDRNPYSAQFLSNIQQEHRERQFTERHVPKSSSVLSPSVPYEGFENPLYKSERDLNKYNAGPLYDSRPTPNQFQERNGQNNLTRYSAHSVAYSQAPTARSFDPYLDQQRNMQTNYTPEGGHAQYRQNPHFQQQNMRPQEPRGNLNSQHSHIQQMPGHMSGQLPPPAYERPPQYYDQGHPQPQPQHPQYTQMPQQQPMLMQQAPQQPMQYQRQSTQQPQQQHYEVSPQRPQQQFMQVSHMPQNNQHPQPHIVNESQIQQQQQPQLIQTQQLVQQPALPLQQQQQIYQPPQAPQMSSTLLQQHPTTGQLTMINNSQMSLQQPPSALQDINQSSIGKASYPESPNNANRSTAQVDNLSEQVKQLQSQLHQVQKEQSTVLDQFEEHKRSSSRTSILHLQHPQSSAVSYQPVVRQDQQQVAHQQPEPMIVHVSNQPSGVNFSHANVDLQGFKLEPDRPSVHGRNISQANLTGNQSTNMANSHLPTQADIFQANERANQDKMAANTSVGHVESMFNYGIQNKKAPSPMIVSNNVTNHMIKPSIAGSTNYSSIIQQQQDSQMPDRNSNATSVIELTPMAEANPSAQPNRPTPGTSPTPTYFTK